MWAELELPPAGTSPPCPALPPAHGHVLLMLSITGISANDPRLFTELEYFSCGLVSYTLPEITLPIDLRQEGWVLTLTSTACPEQ